jgi:FMN phosphatase YigB (HAD superfamily)
MPLLGRKRRTLLLTLDAFNTLYRPLLPIPTQYLSLARFHGLHLHNPTPYTTTTTTQQLTQSFHQAFKTHSSRSPNYGKATPGMTPEHWWASVVIDTFEPLLPHGSRVPDTLSAALFEHFASRSAYELFPDVMPFFRQMKSWKRSLRLGNAGGGGVDKIVVGVLTNSDPRVASVLRSLGLVVGDGNGDGSRLDSENDLDFVLTSYESGYEKPSPAAFEVAEQRARRVRGLPELLSEPFLDGLGEDEGEEGVKVHIGDELQKDFWGAIRARRGWDAVLLDRGAAKGESVYSDVRHVTTLVDVQAEVASLLQRPHG